ncbi:MAG: DnaB-like helicase N-terminal domain-containing protein, partial [Ignavibacteria bacterium]
MAKKKYSKIRTEDPLDETMDIDGGRIPPNALELEAKILGSILIDNLVMNDILQLLEPKHFYRPSHGIIFQAMINLDGKKEPVDPNTLKEELKRLAKLEEIGGIEFIIELTTSISTSANVEFYTRIVFEKFILRNLINISSRIVDKCFDPTSNTFAILDDAEQKILDISESLSKKRVLSVKDELDHLIKSIGDQRENKNAIIGVPTGFGELDDYTAGFQKSEFIVIAGRPSHGKT